MSNVGIRFIDDVVPSDYVKVKAEDFLIDELYTKGRVCIDVSNPRIVLDKKTAIRFAKQLRSEIAKIKE